MRPLCKTCEQRPVAINYYKNEKAHFRSQCDHCDRISQNGTPKWMRAGYRKKLRCDRCGYSSKFTEQFNVYHIDGNLNNCRFDNLKTVCANCQRILYSQAGSWKRGDLTPDL